MAKQKSKTARAPGKRHRGKAPARAAAKSAKRQTRSKTAACLALLERAEGATIAELQKATGWQMHSVRGFLAGTVKKKLGLEITSAKEAHGRVYRISRK